MSGAAVAWLVTWTWQAAALTLVSTVVLRLATRTNASTRHLAWWITLVGVLALAVMPWSWLLIPEYTPASMGGAPAVVLGASPGGGQVGLAEVPPVPLWIVGFGAALWAAYAARRLAALGTLDGASSDRQGTLRPGATIPRTAVATLDVSPARGPFGTTVRVRGCGDRLYARAGSAGHRAAPRSRGCTP